MSKRSLMLESRPKPWPRYEAVQQTPMAFIYLFIFFHFRNWNETTRSNSTIYERFRYHLHTRTNRVVVFINP